MREPEGNGAYGLLARFATEGALRRACRSLAGAGYTCWDTHTPYPVHGLEGEGDGSSSPIARLVLAGGLTGAGAGMLLQTWVHTSAYPLVIGGKPFFSWPAFVPIAFETGILGGALAALAGLLAFAGLPRLHHPLFRSRSFERATDDRFFVSVEARDPLFHPQRTARLLAELGAEAVELIEA